MKQKKKVLPSIVLTLALILLFASTVSAASIKLNKSKVQLNVGASTTLKITGTSKKVTWKSSNKSIATVSSSGKVTGKKAGKATITATVNKKKYKCTVTVVNPVKLNKTSIKLNLKESYQLKVLNTTKKISWKSSNRSIATVSSSGKVTGKKAGKTTITATINKKTYKCSVTVRNTQATNRTTYYIGTDDTMQLSAPNLTDKITWSSNKPNIVSVSKTGVISSPLSGSAMGSAVVTARTKTKTHVFYIHVDGSSLSKSEILIFEGNTARITMNYDYLYNNYSIKTGNSSIVKTERITYTNGFCFEITGAKPGTTTITVVGDGKRTYKLKVTVVKKNKDIQAKTKKVVNLLENKYKLVADQTSQTKHYILNPEADSWEQASITVTKDKEYVGIILPPSGTGTESWLSIVKEVISVMSPKHANSLYKNLISDPFVSSTKILEGMNVTSLEYGDRILEFESGTIRY